MGLFGGTGRAATLNHGKTPLGWHFFLIPKARLIRLHFLSGCFGSTGKEVISEAVSRCILLSSFFLEVKSPKATSSFFSFTFSCFVLLIPPSVLLFWVVWTPPKHFSSLSAMFVYIRVPPNNPIMKRACLVWVPGYHSSPKWAIDASRPSKDSYRAFNSQPRCQNPRSGSLCCKSLFTLNLPLNNA